MTFEQGDRAIRLLPFIYVPSVSFYHIFLVLVFFLALPYAGYGCSPPNPNGHELVTWSG